MKLKASVTRALVVVVAALAVLFSAGVQASQPTVADSAVAWSVAQMSSWSPPGHSFFPGAKETEADGAVRYASIARDAMTVAFDPSEPPLFSGPQGRYRTMALMLAVADFESGFRKDVDTGVGSNAKGDGGQSWCLEQVRLGAASGGRTYTRVVLNDRGISFVFDGTGIGGEDLVSDRKKCLRVALHMMRMSFDACQGAVEGKLSQYASGSCDRGWEASSRRVKKAAKWLAAQPPPSDDAALSAEFAPKPAL